MAVVVSAPGNVQAQSTQECVDAHGEAQVLAKKTKIVEARSKALICAQDSCPKIVRSECIELLESLSKRVPSVVIAVTGPEGDMSDVVVEVDGVEVMDEVTGASLDVDPGTHTFVFRAEGHPPVEKRLVIREGVKRRFVQVTMGEEPDEAPPPGPTEAPPPASSPPPDEPRVESKGVPVGPVILGAVGLVGLGMFAAFGAVGMGERSDLEACKPTCSDDEVDPVRTKFIIADISLAVGVVSLGVATIMLLSGDDEPEAARTSVSVVGGPLQDGGMLGLGGAF